MSPQPLLDTEELLPDGPDRQKEQKGKQQPPKWDSRTGRKSLA